MSVSSFYRKNRSLDIADLEVFLDAGTHGPKLFRYKAPMPPPPPSDSLALLIAKKELENLLRFHPKIIHAELQLVDDRMGFYINYGKRASYTLIENEKLHTAEDARKELERIIVYCLYPPKEEVKEEEKREEEKH